jgi:hypothetical protein
MAPRFGNEPDRITKKEILMEIMHPFHAFGIALIVTVMVLGVLACTAAAVTAYKNYRDQLPRPMGKWIR